MAKIYENQKTHLTTCSGEVTEISADRLSFKIKSQKYNRETKKNEEEIKEWKGATPLPESVKVGKNATAVGCYVANPLDPASEGSQAAYVSAENESFEYKTLAVVNGQIVFARYNEEKNEDGTPKMKKERLGADGVMIPAEPRKPHFDIGISTKETDESGQEIRVLTPSRPTLIMATPARLSVSRSFLQTSTRRQILHMQRLSLVPVRETQGIGSTTALPTRITTATTWA